MYTLIALAKHCLDRLDARFHPIRGGFIHVQRSDWRSYVTVPKGGRDRRGPMTKRLASLPKANRQVGGGGRILGGDDGARFDRVVIWYWMRKAQNRTETDGTERIGWNNEFKEYKTQVSQRTRLNR